MKGRESEDLGGGIRVAAVGDVQLGDCAPCTGWGFASRYSRQDLDPVFAGVSQRLRADVTIGNLETMLSRSGVDEAQWASIQMRGYPHYATSLRRAGFTVLNVANNHAAQHGHAAFMETVEALRSAGLHVCGLRGEGRWSSIPAVIQLPGRGSIGCLGYSMRPRQFSQDRPWYAEADPPRMLSDVTRLSRQVQHVIVSLHWGEEYVGSPSEEQVQIARDLVEAGTSAILGHHPHVLGPVEHFKGRLIAYSLGNFVTDMLWREELRSGAILSFGLFPEGVGRVELIPTQMDGDYKVNICDLDISHLRTWQLAGLPEADYRREVKRTVRAFRMSKYAHALRHIFRYPSSVLRQLFFQTVMNKLELAQKISARVKSDRGS